MKFIKRFELRVRRERVEEFERVGPLTSAREVAHYAHQLLDHEDVEIVLAFLLDARNRLIGVAEVARGTVDHAVIYQRELFRIALIHGVSAVIIAHNHPSGEATPSEEDLAVTARTAESAKLLGIALLDHVIVTAPIHPNQGAHFSLLDAGLMPT